MKLLIDGEDVFPFADSHVTDPLVTMVPHSPTLSEMDDGVSEMPFYGVADFGEIYNFDDPLLSSIAEGEEFMPTINPNLIFDMSPLFIEPPFDIINAELAPETEKLAPETEKLAYHPIQDHCYSVGARPNTPDDTDSVSSDDFIDVSSETLTNIDLKMFQDCFDDDDADAPEYDEPIVEIKCKKSKSKSLPLVAMPEETIDVWNENDSSNSESSVKKKLRNTSTPKKYALPAKRTCTVREEPYSKKAKTTKSSSRLKPSSSDVENALKAPRGRTRKPKHYTKKSDKGNKRIDHNELEKERRTQQRDLLNKLHKSIPIEYFKPEENNTKKHSKQSILRAARNCVEGIDSEARTLKDIQRQLDDENRKLFSEYLKVRKSIVKIAGYKNYARHKDSAQ